MKIFTGLFFYLFIPVAGFSQDSAVAETVLDRYRSFLFLTDTGAGSALPPPVNEYGRWQDIDYSGDEAGKWQVAAHLRRIKTLSMAWAGKPSVYYHDTTVQKNIVLALADWCRHRYKSRNWWHNEIGIPQLMRDILVLSGESLPDTSFRQSLQVMAQYQLKGTGANLVWSADIALHYGALTRNIPLMKKCSDTLQSVIRITEEEGVQPDFSFHQHGKRLQVYHYGGAFLLDNMRLAWQLRQTALSFSAAKIAVLVDFVLKGWQWMARGINTVPGTIDRAASRTNALQSADIRPILPLFKTLLPDSTAAFDQLLAVQQGRKALNGYRYFPYSDFTAYQQPGYSFFLKTNSTRTLLTESINGENLQGGLLNSGDAYFIRNGKEYFNLMPVWDWNRLPGITSIGGDKKAKIQQTVFTGNVSDGQSGMAVLQLKLRQDEKLLEARKCWISSGNTTVILIAGVNDHNQLLNAFTVMDQSRWQGNVSTSLQPGKPFSGLQHFSKLSWVYHNCFVYIPLYADSVVLEARRKEGNWSAINKSEPDGLVQDSVFMPLIIHRQRDTASGYAVTYAASPAAAARAAMHPAWRILSNDTLCQALLFNDGTLAVALYKAGQKKLKASLTISSSRPCLLLQKKGLLYISDPAHRGGPARVTVNGQHFDALLPADGTTVLLQVPH